MPKGGAWSNSNKNRMLSNVQTVQNQGGGEKKAGFPYQVGRSSWTSMFIHSVAPVSGNCCSHEKIMKMPFTSSRQNTVRPLNIRSNIKMH